MHKTIIILTTTLSLLIIAEVFGVWDALLVFLLVGTIPGTNMSLPPLAMLGCIVLISGLIALILVSQTEPTPQPSKKTLPKKRYSRI
jgi:hypothetical protein